jgi:hypothetical protein
LRDEIALNSNFYDGCGAICIYDFIFSAESDSSSSIIKSLKIPRGFVLKKFYVGVLISYF